MAGCSAQGGKRRKSKKHSRKTRGGMSYGMGANAEVLNAGNFVRSTEMTSVPPAGMGGGRRRKSRKGRRSTRRHRGGMGSAVVGTAGYGFTGTGVAGLANPAPYAAGVPAA